MTASRLLLVGGGRWGRVHADVLARMGGRIRRVQWVTGHDRASVGKLLIALGCRADMFELHSDVGSALASCPDAAIVANSAHQHARTVEQLLRAGVPVLVEKPLSLDLPDAERLVTLADQRGIELFVGLHLFHARYLHHFVGQWHSQNMNREIAKIEVAWLDPLVEVRHGEAKSASIATHLADDLVPHVWSLLRTVCPTQSVQFGAVEVLRNGAARLGLSMGPIDVTAVIGRRHEMRRRSIEIIFHDGRKAALDFTTEPGSMTIDGRGVASLADWQHEPKPLASEITAFLDAIDNPARAKASPQLGRHCLPSVSLAGDVRDGMEVAQAALVANLIGATQAWSHPDVAIAIADNLAHLLSQSGYRIAAADAAMASVMVTAVRAYVEEGGLFSPSDKLAADLRNACTGSRFVDRLTAFCRRGGALRIPKPAS